MIEKIQAETTLKRLQTNPRVWKIGFAIPEGACPACQSVQGTYEKDVVPALPFESCSCAAGCRAHYIPLLYQVHTIGQDTVYEEGEGLVDS